MGTAAIALVARKRTMLHQKIILTLCALGCASAYENVQFAEPRTLPADAARERAVEDEVRRLYTLFPYPPRKVNAKSMPKSRSSDIPSINQFILNGRKSFAADEKDPLRVLVAGCGTGDNMLSLAAQLAAYSPTSEIVCLELSTESQRIAKARVELWRKKLGTVKITMIRDSILNIPEMTDLGQFDLINCFGVLHHIDNPDKALSILSSVLKPKGGMVLMVYGRYGRTSVYPMLHMARSMAKAGNIDPVSIEMAEMVDSLIHNLPASNLLNATTYWVGPWGSNLRQHDILTFVANTFLHPRALEMAEDPSYTVDDTVAFLERAGLRMSSFMTPFRYEPHNYKLPDKLQQNVQNMTWINQAAFAEAFVGNMIMHTFYAVKNDNKFVPPHVSDSDVYPLLRTECDIALAGEEMSEVSLEALNQGITARDKGGNLFEFALPPLSAKIIALFKGDLSLAEVAKSVFEDVEQNCSDTIDAANENDSKDATTNKKCYDQSSVVNQVSELAKVLQSLGKIALSRVPFRAVKVPYGENRKECNWMPSEKQ